MTADGTKADYIGLRSLEPTLPSAFYYDPGQYERELNALWYRNWVYAFRAKTLTEPGSFKTVRIDNQTALVIRDEEGALRAFHNTCRHRGSVLCRTEAGRLGKLITCPYHAWSYDLRGNLRRVPSLSSPEGFGRKSFSLYPVALTEWRGLVFLCFDPAHAPPFSTAFARGSDRLDHWPLEDLVSAHSFTREIACNWKIFWENYNECLHCPGVHPELCDVVPIYGRGIMSEREDPNWAEHAASDDPRHKGGIGRHSETWTSDGKAVGRTFDGLTEAERRAGHHFMTSLPSMFLVGHVDYVRITYLRPLGPERTELTSEWMFPAETLADPTFDLAKAVDFVKLVQEQDANACELNQRGIRALPHAGGVLMPEEMYVHDFHQWVRQGLAAAS
jgi:Rieske 2Fe-2S family protein